MVVNDWRVISDKAQAEADRVVDQIITSGMSDYDIAKALHDYLILNCDYDKRLYSGNMPYTSYTAEGALLEGLPCARATPRPTRPCWMPPAYPMRWSPATPADTTPGIWCRSTGIGTTWTPPGTTPTNRGGDYIRYDYFLKSDAAIGKDHRTGMHPTSAPAPSMITPICWIPQSRPSRRRNRRSWIRSSPSATPPWELPYSTQAELQALDDNTLRDALYFYIDFSNSGIDASVLSMRYRDAGEAITQRDPDLQMRSFERSRMSYKLYRADVMAEIQRRQDAAKEQQAQQQAQNEAAALKVEALLQEAITGMDCGKLEITIEGYSPMW